jgi:hypothetical protein
MVTVIGMVNPSAADTVTFDLYSSATVQDSTTLVFTDTETVAFIGIAATATASYTPTAAGTFYWVDAFSGDANNAPASSRVEPLHVDALSTSAPPGSVGVGSPMSDMATITGVIGNPIDTVTFNLYSSATVQDSTTLLFSDTETAAVSGTTATATSASYTPTAAGTDYWVATFSGDANNAPVSSGPAAVLVNFDAISITALPASTQPGKPIGASVTITGLVNPSNADVVTFTLYSSATKTVVFQLEPATITISGGTATARNTTNAFGAFIDTSFFTPGAYYWVAVFSGDSNNASLTSDDAPVNLDAISTKPEPNLVSVGTPIGATATITGLVAPNSADTVTFNLYSSATSGTLLFSDTETVALSGGTATATSKTYTPTAAGADAWVATFSGDSNNALASNPAGNAIVKVNAISTSAQPALASVGTPIGATATVTGSKSNTGGNLVPNGAGAIIVGVPGGPAAVSTTAAVSAAPVPAGSMVAGTGAATLKAGASGDTLAGGSTHSDTASTGPTYDQKLADLDSIMAEWGSGDTYVTGPRKPAGDPSTVHVKGKPVADSPYGKALVRDWYFAGLNDV